MLWRKVTVFTDLDDAMLSLALRDAWPGVRFVDDTAESGGDMLAFRPSIAACRRSLVSIRFAEEGWRPVFGADRHGTGRRLLNPPRHTLFYQRSAWFHGQPGGRQAWAFDLPSLSEGSMSIHIDGESEEDRGFVRSVWRIVRGLSTDRLKSAYDRDVTVNRRDVRPLRLRAGFAALEWCRAGPRRAIAGGSLPCDDWQPPRTPAYADLRRRALDLLGGKAATGTEG